MDLLDPSAAAVDEPRLSPEFVRKLTDYSQPSKQLAALHEAGFWRARRSRVTGEVILERAHYLAVCAGLDRKPASFMEATPLLASEQR